MEQALDRRDERIARRVRIAVRVVLYPAAVALIVVAWRHQHSQASNGDVGWKGSTSQGQDVQAWISRDGFLTALDTRVLELCSDGSSFDGGWEVRRTRFVQHGADVRSHLTGSNRTSTGWPDVYDGTIQARITAHPRGTIWTRERVTTDAGTFTCESGAVTFTLTHR
jgi:hypothetical protein